MMSHDLMLYISCIESTGKLIVLALNGTQFSTKWYQRYHIGTISSHAPPPLHLKCSCS